DMMDNKAMYMHTVNDRDNSSIFEEPFDGRSLSKLNLCEDGPCHKRRVGGCCTQLGSLSALKHAVLGLYLLVFLILVGIFILAANRSTPGGENECCQHEGVHANVLLVFYSEDQEKHIFGHEDKYLHCIEVYSHTLEREFTAL
ncbi:hypothetical protein A6R68_01430, partial [Neotoma lepida]